MHWMLLGKLSQRIEPALTGMGLSHRGTLFRPLPNPVDPKAKRDNQRQSRGAKPDPHMGSVMNRHARVL